MDDLSQKKPMKQLARKQRAAWLILLLENISRYGWRIFLWTLFFASLWTFPLAIFIGKLSSTVLAAIFWLGALYLIYKDVRHLRLPTARQIDKRLEQSSKLSYRPIEAFKDRLANPEHVQTRALWEKHKQNNLNLIKQLKLPAPKAFLAETDQYALRIAVFLLFILAVVAAPSNWSQNIKKGMFPYISADTSIPLTLWITPPEYTGLEIITLLNKKPDEPITVPQGSTVKIRIDSRFITPTLHMGDTKIALTKAGDHNWQIETEIPQTDSIKIKHGFLPRYNLPIHYKHDEPPTLTLEQDKKPTILPKGALQFPLIARDDYGISNLQMTMTLDPMVTDKPLGGAVTEDRPFTSIAETDTTLLPYYDLSWHPWAGLPVNITLTATDDLGQTSSLPPFSMTLPERVFEHPIAKLLIEMRRRLSWTPNESARDVADALEELLPYPSHYQDDIVVFLSMRTMASRLRRDPTLPNITGIISQLWDTALRIEDGNLSLAARNLRDAQQNLQTLLNDKNATDEQIAEAMADLRQAMSEYFQEIARELQKRMANGEPMPMMPADMLKSLNADDLAAFLDQLQSESLSGDRSKAMDMLSRLEEMMNTIDPAMNAQMPPGMQFMQEGINELQELIDKQKALLKQTERQAATIEQAQPQNYGDIIAPDELRNQSTPKELDALDDLGLPQPQSTFKTPAFKHPEINTQGHKVEQDALRFVLGQLMLEADKQIHEIPESMQNAEIEMRLSADHLGENNPDQSIPNQNAAIKYLEEAQEQMTQQLMAMMQQMQTLGFGPGQTDPFGRPIQQGNGPSWFQGDKVKVPDEAERKRAQDILKELRDRSSDRSRPAYELDYYNRLMNQF